MSSEDSLVVGSVRFSVTEKRGVGTYEENEAGVVIPVTIELLVEEERKNCGIFGFSLWFRGIETTHGSPADFVPSRYHIRGSLDRSRRFYRLDSIEDVVRMVFSVLNGYRGNDVRVSGVESELWERR